MSVQCPKCNKDGELHDLLPFQTMGRRKIAYVLHEVPHSEVRRTCHLNREERATIPDNETHTAGCICADCAGADLTAEND